MKGHFYVPPEYSTENRDNGDRGKSTESTHLSSKRGGSQKNTDYLRNDDEYNKFLLDKQI